MEVRTDQVLLEMRFILKAPKARNVCFLSYYKLLELLVVQSNKTIKYQHYGLSHQGEFSQNLFCSSPVN